MSKDAQKQSDNRKPPTPPKAHVRTLSLSHEPVDVHPTQKQIEEKRRFLENKAAYLEAVKLDASVAKLSLHGASSRSASPSSPSVSPASASRSIMIRSASSPAVKEPLPEHVKKRLINKIDTGLKDIKDADLDVPGMPSRPRSPSSSRSRVMTTGIYYEDHSSVPSPRPGAEGRWATTVSPVLNARRLEAKQQEPSEEQQSPQSAVAKLAQQSGSPASRDKSPGR